jgi:hypothetical protein
MSLPVSLAIGQAGVYRVAAELLLRRVACSLPIVDTGVDIQLATGVRLQVKSARLHATRNKDKNFPSMGPGYRFTLSMRYQRPLQRTASLRTMEERGYIRRRYSDLADYLVFWGVDEDRFWIVPARLCDDRRCLVIPPRTRALRGGQSFLSQVVDHEGRWEPLLPVQQTESLLHVVGEN